MASEDGTYSTNLEAWALPDVAPSVTVTSNSSVMKRYEHLTNIPFPHVDSEQVDILIGLNAPGAHRVLEEVTGGETEPIARRLPLGWVCLGPLKDDFEQQHASSEHTLCAEVKRDTDLEGIVRRLWEVDSWSPAVDSEYLTPAEKEAEILTAASLQYTDQRFEVGLPWNETGGPSIQNNRPMAERRLVSLEKTLNKDVAVQEQYRQAMEKNIKQGYVREVPDTQVGLDGDKQWFLPHFPVVKQDRQTTKVRIVFDAAATWRGSSLNDHMLTGPRLQNNLVHVLLRFCAEPVALAGDISEMFLQVRLRDEDRRYVRFLWRKTPESEPTVFEFTRLVFGLKSSPYLASRVLRETAARFDQDSDREVNSIVKDNFYVDDLLTSFPNTGTAATARQKVTEVLQKGGFRIRKWLSNSPELLETIPEEDRAANVVVNLQEQTADLPSSKALGVIWLADKDQFTFQCPLPTSDTKLTKRAVLRETAAIFDPRGQLIPFTIRPRMMFQEACVRGHGWDDPLSPEEQQRWHKWFAELPALSDIRIDRCFKPKSTSPSDTIRTEIHTFVDASDAAVAAVSYVRTTSSLGVKTTLAMSKARLAPVKKVSIPKMELKAAVLGVEISQEVATALNIPIKEHHFWTDSMNVLYWVRSHSRRFTTDVGVKIGEIQTASSGSQWRHVPGKQNPADLPTRGMVAKDLVSSKVWWHGPAFLELDESDWPSVNIVVPGQLPCEVKRNRVFTYTTTVLTQFRLSPERYSSWTRLKRVTAWCFRFLAVCANRVSISKARMSESDQAGLCVVKGIHQMLTPSDATLDIKACKVPELSVLELERATRYWIARAQKESYPDTVKAVLNGKPLQPADPLLRLHPQLDDSMYPPVLQLGGRLDQATRVPSSTRRPCILPNKHRITDLIIAEEDQKCHHAVGTNYLWANLSDRYWIIRGKQAVKSWRCHCNGCIRVWRKPAEQVMGQLPSTRVEMTQKAFANVGVDYAGPFFTKQGRGRTQAKRYLCLFTCQETRACHLEIAFDLSTEGFLQCYTRFSKRRGVPKTVTSDNGTNFVAAERMLRDAVNTIDKSKVAAEAAGVGTTWKFNPPRSPHHGGFFEAMVKSAKRAIYAILQGANFNDEELMTAFVQAEALLNSRPLTIASTESDDLRSLSPQDFLIGHQDTTIPIEMTIDSESKVHPQRRWEHVQRATDAIWKRWLKEFLPTLNVRQKWNRSGRIIKVGDVVLYVAQDTPRGKWPLGRVSEVFPGPDGKVRVVNVTVKGKVYRRPINLLVPLEVEPQH